MYDDGYNRKKNRKRKRKPQNHGEKRKIKIKPVNKSNTTAPEKVSEQVPEYSGPEYKEGNILDIPYQELPNMNVNGNNPHQTKKRIKTKPPVLKRNDLLSAKEEVFIQTIPSIFLPDDAITSSPSKDPLVDKEEDVINQKDTVSQFLPSNSNNLPGSEKSAAKIEKRKRRQSKNGEPNKCKIRVSKKTKLKEDFSVVDVSDVDSLRKLISGEHSIQKATHVKGLSFPVNETNTGSGNDVSEVGKLSLAPIIDKTVVNTSDNSDRTIPVHSDSLPQSVGNSQLQDSSSRKSVNGKAVRSHSRPKTNKNKGILTVRKNLLKPPVLQIPNDHDEEKMATVKSESISSNIANLNFNTTWPVTSNSVTVKPVNTLFSRETKSVSESLNFGQHSSLPDPFQCRQSLSNQRAKFGLPRSINSNMNADQLNGEKATPKNYWQIGNQTLYFKSNKDDNNDSLNLTITRTNPAKQTAFTNGKNVMAENIDSNHIANKPQSFTHPNINSSGIPPLIKITPSMTTNSFKPSNENEQDKALIANSAAPQLFFINRVDLKPLNYPPLQSVFEEPVQENEKITIGTQVDILSSYFKGNDDLSITIVPKNNNSCSSRKQASPRKLKIQEYCDADISIVKQKACNESEDKNTNNRKKYSKEVLPENIETVLNSLVIPKLEPESEEECESLIEIKEENVKQEVPDKYRRQSERNTRTIPEHIKPMLFPSVPNLNELKTFNHYWSAHIPHCAICAAFALKNNKGSKQMSPGWQQSKPTVLPENSPIWVRLNNLL